jgi:hypothetical protein
MKKMMNLLMLSCKKATELIEKKSIFKLSFRENLQLQMHKSMCDACKSYEIQSQKIDSILKNQQLSDIYNTNTMFKNDKLKEKILKNFS